MPANAAFTEKDIPRIRRSYGDNAPVLCVVGQSDCRVWGLTSKERFTRMVRPFGINDVRNEGESLPSDGEVILVRADYAIEDRVINRLIGQHFGKILVIECEEGSNGKTIPIAAHVSALDAPAVAEILATGRLADGETVPHGVALAGPVEIGTAYNRKLRKREAPYVMKLDDQSVETIENRIFAGSYKGITDFVTKYAWPLPARWATRQAVRFGWTPNAVTAASLVLVFATIWLFMQGQFLAGLAVGFVMTFLDTVDGKLARVTLTSSRWGNVFDHSIDLIHPPFWYAAWWYGLHVAGLADDVPYLDEALWIVVGGYIVGRLLELLFNTLFRIQIHTWRPIDSFFRLITARRNPNIVILTLATLAGRPDVGFLLLALWTGISVLFHGIRLLQAAASRGDSGGLRSWLMETV
jgi:phosphatidylserine synthase